MTGAADIDWGALEDHVIDGVFSPPTTGNGHTPRRETSARSKRPPRNSELHNEVIPAALFSYNASTATFKTTMERLRAHVFCSLITLHNEKTGKSVEFYLVNVERNAVDWRRMRFESISREHRGQYQLIILNDDAAAREPSSAPEISVVRDGLRWVAEFRWSTRNKDAVKGAGFRFSPVERLWYTQDPHAAAVFDPALRAELARQRSNLNPPHRSIVTRIRDQFAPRRLKRYSQSGHHRRIDSTKPPPVAQIASPYLDASPENRGRGWILDKVDADVPF